MVSAVLEPVEAVEDEVDRERELGGAIACSEGAVVGDREGHLHDVGVGGAELALQLGGGLRAEVAVPGIVEERLGEPERSAAEDVYGLVRLGDGEAAFAQGPDHGVDVPEGRWPGRRAGLYDARRPRVAGHHLPRGERHLAQRGLPAGSAGTQRYLTDHGIGHAVQQVAASASLVEPVNSGDQLTSRLGALADIFDLFTRTATGSSPAGGTLNAFRDQLMNRLTSDPARDQARATVGQLVYVNRIRNGRLHTDAFNWTESLHQLGVPASDSPAEQWERIRAITVEAVYTIIELLQASIQ